MGWSGSGVRREKQRLNPNGPGNQPVIKQIQASFLGFRAKGLDGGTNGIQPQRGTGKGRQQEREGGCVCVCYMYNVSVYVCVCMCLIVCVVCIWEGEGGGAFV